MFGWMVQTMVVSLMPSPINLPLKETLEAGVPLQLQPLQPVPDALH